MLWVSFPYPSKKGSGAAARVAVTRAGNLHASTFLLCAGVTSFRKHISSPCSDGRPVPGLAPAPLSRMAVRLSGSGVASRSLPASSRRMGST